MYENRVLRICGAKGMEVTRRRVRLLGLILSNKCYQNNQIHEEWIREDLNNVRMELQFHPDSAWKRTSKTCMTLTSAECTVQMTGKEAARNK
jgi:hypothetical protein